MSHDNEDELLHKNGDEVRSPAAKYKAKREKTNPRPKFDYANWPEVGHEGIKGTAGHILTKALFVEVATWPYKTDPMYTMKSAEVFDSNLQKWLPSARQIYVAAPTEYDAIRRLVGSLEQWNKLLQLKWFVEGDSYQGFAGLNEWKIEAEMRRQAEAHKLLIAAAQDGDIGAAKALFHAANKNPRGRPRKGVGTLVEAPDTDVDDDFSRIQSSKVVNFPTSQ